MCIPISILAENMFAHGVLCRCWLVVLWICFVSKSAVIYGIYTQDRPASIFVSVTRTPARQAPILNAAPNDRLIVKRHVGRSVRCKHEDRKGCSYGRCPK